MWHEDVRDDVAPAEFLLTRCHRQRGPGHSGKERLRIAACRQLVVVLALGIGDDSHKCAYLVVVYCRSSAVGAGMSSHRARLGCRPSLEPSVGSGEDDHLGLGDRGGALDFSPTVFRPRPSSSSEWALAAWRRWLRLMLGIVVATSSTGLRVANSKGTVAASVLLSVVRGCLRSLGCPSESSGLPGGVAPLAEAAAHPDEIMTTATPPSPEPSGWIITQIAPSERGECTSCGSRGRASGLVPSRVSAQPTSTLR